MFTSPHHCWLINVWRLIVHGGAGTAWFYYLLVFFSLRSLVRSTPYTSLLLRNGTWFFAWCLLYQEETEKRDVTDLKMISNYVTYMKMLSFTLAFRESFYLVSNWLCGCQPAPWLICCYSICWLAGFFRVCALSRARFAWDHSINVSYCLFSFSPFLWTNKATLSPFVWDLFH